MSPRRLIAVAGTGALALALLAARSDAGAAEPATVEFAFTGAPQTWEVPEGITEITATTCGAQGGAGVGGAHGDPVAGTEGGLGGCATGVLPVTPGETLTIMVGGQGAASTVNAPIGNLAATSTGGFNGGAAGGTAIELGFAVIQSFCLEVQAFVAAAGGGGGGASDIRQGGDTLADRVLVGGGGGGGAAAGVVDQEVDDVVCPIPSPAGAAGSTPVEVTLHDAGSGHASVSLPPGVAPAATSPEVVVTTAGGAGGNGGGASGGSGERGTDGASAVAGEGGGGGTSAAGGPGGVSPAGSGLAGTSGEGGEGDGEASSQVIVGGAESVQARAGASAGGGGGGGWFGGGGGAPGQWLAPTDIAGGGGGGGGSGFGPSGTSFEAGVNAGDGSVLITYGGDEPPEPEPEPPDVVGVIEARPTFAG